MDQRFGGDDTGSYNSGGVGTNFNSYGTNLNGGLNTNTFVKPAVTGTFQQSSGVILPNGQYQYTNQQTGHY